MGEDYTYAASGNVLSRSARIKGARYVVNKGHSLVDAGAEIRGDLHNASGEPIISWGRYTCLGRDCHIEPPHRQGKRFPCVIGNYVSIGANAHVEAASIGSWVIVGEDCQIGRFAIIKDGVVIAPGTVVPPFAVVAPQTILKGPGLMDQTQAPESLPEVVEQYCRDLHAGRLPRPLPF